MDTSNSPSSKEKSPPQQIDAIINKSGDWRGRKLSQLRALIKDADPAIVEDVKWKKQSNPMGVPVWFHDGNICIGEMLKNAVRLTFPKDAQIEDRNGLFNTRLNSKTVRAIDFHEKDNIDETALKELVRAAIDYNISIEKKK